MLAIRQAAAIGPQVVVGMDAIEGLWLLRTFLICMVIYLTYRFYSQHTRKPNETLAETMLQFGDRVVSVRETLKESESEEEYDTEEEVSEVASSAEGGQVEVAETAQGSSPPDRDTNMDFARKLHAFLEHKFVIAFQLIYLLLYLYFYVYATQVKFRIDFWRRNSILISMHDSCLGITKADWQEGTTCEVNLFLKYSIDTYLLEYAHALQIIHRFRIWDFATLTLFSCLLILRALSARGAPEFVKEMRAQRKDGQEDKRHLKNATETTVLEGVYHFFRYDYFALFELLLGSFGGFWFLLMPEKVSWMQYLTSYVLPLQHYALCSLGWVFLFRVLLECCEYSIFLHIISHCMQSQKTVLKIYFIIFLSALLLQGCIGLWLQRCTIGYELADGSDLYSFYGKKHAPFQPTSDRAFAKDEYGRYLRFQVSTIESIAGSIHYGMTMLIGLGPPDSFLPQLGFFAVLFFCACYLHAGCYAGFLGAVLDVGLEHMHDTVNELLGEQDKEVEDLVTHVPLRSSALVVESLQKVHNLEYGFPPVDDSDDDDDGAKEEDNDGDAADEDGEKARSSEQRGSTISAAASTEETFKETLLSRVTFLDHPVYNTFLQFLFLIPVTLATPCFEYEEFESRHVFADEPAEQIFKYCLIAEGFIILFHFCEFIALFARVHNESSVLARRRQAEGNKEVEANCAYYPFTFFGFVDVGSWLLPALALVICLFGIIGQGDGTASKVGEILKPNNLKNYFQEWPSVPPYMDPTDFFWICGYMCQLESPHDMEKRQLAFLTLLVCGRILMLFKPMRYYNTINTIITGCHNNRHVLRFSYAFAFCFLLLGSATLYLSSYDALLPEEQYDCNSLHMGMWEMFQKMVSLESGNQHQIWGWNVFLSTVGAVIAAISFSIYASAFDFDVDETEIPEDRGLLDDPENVRLAELPEREWIEKSNNTSEFVKWCTKTFFEDMHGPGLWYFWRGFLAICLSFWAVHAYSSPWYQHALLDAHLTELVPGQDSLLRSMQAHQLIAATEPYDNDGDEAGPDAIKGGKEEPPEVEIKGEKVSDGPGAKPQGKEKAAASSMLQLSRREQRQRRKLWTESKRKSETMFGLLSNYHVPKLWEVLFGSGIEDETDFAKILRGRGSASGTEADSRDFPGRRDRGALEQQGASSFLETDSDDRGHVVSLLQTSQTHHTTHHRQHTRKHNHNNSPEENRRKVRRLIEQLGQPKRRKAAPASSSFAEKAEAKNEEASAATSSAGGLSEHFHQTVVDFKNDKSLHEEPDEELQEEESFFNPDELKLSTDGITMFRRYDSEKLQVYTSGLDRLKYEPFAITGIGDELHDADFLLRVSTKTPKRIEDILGKSSRIRIKTGEADLEDDDGDDKDKDDSTDDKKADAKKDDDKKSASAAAALELHLRESHRDGEVGGDETKATEETGKAAGEEPAGDTLQFVDFVTSSTQRTEHLFSMNYSLLNGRAPSLERLFFFTNVCMGAKDVTDMSFLVHASAERTKKEEYERLRVEKKRQQFQWRADGDSGELNGGRYGESWHSEEEEAAKGDEFSPDKEVKKLISTDLTSARINADKKTPSSDGKTLIDLGVGGSLESTREVVGSREQRDQVRHVLDTGNIKNNDQGDGAGNSDEPFAVVAVAGREDRRAVEATTSRSRSSASSALEQEEQQSRAESSNKAKSDAGDDAKDKKAAEDGNSKSSTTLLDPLPSISTEDYTAFYAPIRMVDPDKEDVPWNCGDLMPFVLLEDDTVRQTTYRKGLPAFPEIAVETHYVAPIHNEKAKEKFFEQFADEVAQYGPAVNPQLADSKWFRMKYITGIVSRDGLRIFLPLIVFLVDVFVLLVYLYNYLVLCAVYFYGDSYHKAKYLYSPSRKEYDELIGRRLPPGTSSKEKVEYANNIPNRRGVSPVLMFYNYAIKKPDAGTVIVLTVTIITHVLSFTLGGVRMRLLDNANTALVRPYLQYLMGARVFAAAFYFSSFNTGFGLIVDVVRKNRMTLFHAYYLALMIFFVIGGLVFLTERKNGNVNEGETQRFTSFGMASLFASRLFTGNMGMVKEYSPEGTIVVFLIMILAGPAILGIFAGILTDGLMAELDHSVLHQQVEHFYEHEELVRACALKWKKRAHELAEQRRKETAGNADATVPIFASRGPHMGRMDKLPRKYAYGADSYLRQTWFPGKVSLLLHLFASFLAIYVSAPSRSIDVLVKPGENLKKETAGNQKEVEETSKLFNKENYPAASREPGDLRSAAEPDELDETAPGASSSSSSSSFSSFIETTSSTAGASLYSSSSAVEKTSRKEELRQAADTKAVLHLPDGEASKKDADKATAVAKTTSITATGVGPNGEIIQAGVTETTLEPAKDEETPSLADSLEEPKYKVNDKRLLESSLSPTTRVPDSLAHQAHKWAIDPDGEMAQLINFRALYMQGDRPFVFYYLLLPLHFIFLVELLFACYVDRMSYRNPLKSPWRWLNFFLIVLLGAHLAMHQRLTAMYGADNEEMKPVLFEERGNTLEYQKFDMAEKTTEDSRLVHLYASPTGTTETINSGDKSAPEKKEASGTGDSTLETQQGISVRRVEDGKDKEEKDSSTSSTSPGATTSKSSPDSAKNKEQASDNDRKEEKKDESEDVPLPPELIPEYKKLDSIAKDNFGLHPTEPKKLADAAKIDITEPYDPKAEEKIVRRDKLTGFQVYCIHMQEYTIAFLACFHGLFFAQHLMTQHMRKVLTRMLTCLQATAFPIMCVFLCTCVVFGELFFLFESYRTPAWKFGPKTKTGGRQQVFLENSVNTEFNYTPNGLMFSSLGDGFFIAFNLLNGNWETDDYSEAGNIITWVICFFGIGVGALPVAAVMQAVGNAIAADQNFLSGAKDDLAEAVKADETRMRGRQAKLMDLVKQVKSGKRVSRPSATTSNLRRPPKD
ncbi:unnamed protein product [Amoebophrya sp. A120]|nr:unnamed protein product [Amoebophrya sp. A120]|eukprot:GSA120T00010752001.1